MSTKIYNGIIFEVKDLNALLKKLKALHAPMDAIKTAHVNRLYSNKMVIELDRQQLLPKRAKRKTFRDLRVDIKMEIMDKMIESKRKITSNFPYDCDFSVSVIPIKGKILGLYYSRLNEHEKFFTKLPWVKEYHYQNQTDQPDDVSDKEWNQRKRDWDKALPGFGMPAREGYSFEILDNDFPIGHQFHIDYKVVPSVKKRAHDIARDRVYHAYMKKNPGIEWFKAMDYTKTGVGKKKVDLLAPKIAKKLKRKYLEN